MSLATGVVMLNPRFHGPKWRRFRMNCFLLTGFFASAPMVHGTIRWGREFVRKTGVRYYLLEILLILVGCFFYEVYIYPYTYLFKDVFTDRNKRRIPERLFPGRFDIWLHSHTIWHLFVVGAVAMHLVGTLTALDYDYHHRSVCYA